MNFKKLIDLTNNNTEFREIIYSFLNSGKMDDSSKKLAFSIWKNTNEECILHVNRGFVGKFIPDGMIPDDGDGTTDLDVANAVAFILLTEEIPEFDFNDMSFIRYRSRCEFYPLTSYFLFNTSSWDEVKKEKERFEVFLENELKGFLYFVIMVIKEHIIYRLWEFDYFIREKEQEEMRGISY